MTQEQALAILKTGASVFLTGQPGSGKTHTINQYVAWLRGYSIEPALTASTGIAATHISGMTIHSWSGIGIANELSRWDLDRIASNERVVKRIAKAHVLIIDEISMLDARTLQMVDAVCRRVRRSDLPFGGLQTILVGDFFQLPPIAREGRTAEFAFRSPAWHSLHPTVCYLSEQYRQDDTDFLSVLGAIRNNTIEKTHRQILASRQPDGDEIAEDIVKLYSHNMDVDRLNDHALARLEGDNRTYEMRTKGAAHLIESLKRSCLSPAALRLKPGAAVMFTRNDPQGKFVNGTLGTVVRFQKGTGYPVVRVRAGAEIAAEPMEWKIEDQGDVLASVEQIPLRLAWAMTIHKSQGMSLDCALMDLGSAFEYGQGYVALSRVRRLSGLFLVACNERALQVHPDILAQDRVFLEDSSAAEKEHAAWTEEEREKIAHAFVTACGGRLGAAKKKPSALHAARATSPKAYTRWTACEEKELVSLFNDGSATQDIARKLERKQGGIISRLKKLGLIEE